MEYSLFSCAFYIVQVSFNLCCIGDGHIISSLSAEFSWVQEHYYKASYNIISVDYLCPFSSLEFFYMWWSSCQSTSISLHLVCESQFGHFWAVLLSLSTLPSMDSSIMH
ncbi:Protein of unknown function [Cotesia congregata]|uniref:Uncharacterized protein n=1 Tax=Cotesia congregata TaxID=51543 RepID=A0A8J2MYQ3_COTCN|nr:Protein of unknown function [Cotesia congregata]